jgi:hypothetical protein
VPTRTVEGFAAEIAMAVISSPLRTEIGVLARTHVVAPSVDLHMYVPPIQSLWLFESSTTNGAENANPPSEERPPFALLNEAPPSVDFLIDPWAFSAYSVLGSFLSIPM